MSILFDPTNLTSTMVGDAHGISAEELKAAEPAALAALASFHESVDRATTDSPTFPFKRN